MTTPLRPLRNPSLAPVYAAVIAFLVVLSLGKMFPTPGESDDDKDQSKDAAVQPTVRIVVGADQEVMLDLTTLLVGIREDADTWEPAALDSHGNLMVGEGIKVLDRYVCISLPLGWTVQDDIQQLGAGQTPLEGKLAPSTCTVKTIEAADDQQAVLTLARPVVRVETDGGPPPGHLKDVQVTVGGAVVGVLDDKGRHFRMDAAGGKKVCVTPPPGWDVVGVRLDKRPAPAIGSCVSELKGPAASPEIVFTLQPRGH